MAAIDRKQDLQKGSLEKKSDRYTSAKFPVFETLLTWRCALVSLTGGLPETAIYE